MIIQPRVRGFICTTAHPAGCAENVKRQIAYTQSQPKLASGPKKVLVIGASTGYGLASRIAAAFGADAQTIGVFFERPAEGKRTASAGWYNTAAFEQEAAQAGLYAKSINGDAFSDEIKQQTIDLIKQDWNGEVDLVIYSLASPLRTDPATGVTHRSCLKPMGETYTNKTVNVMDGTVSEISIDPANDEDVANTIKVMGGEDWQIWMDKLLENNLLAQGAKTLAYSYIGPDITYPVYRKGTIGAAKDHLEATAIELNKLLKEKINGEAFVSVNKALVTQASSAIPVVPLYISLLFKIMKEKNNHEGCIEQMVRLFADRLYNPSNTDTPVDEQSRIRVDDWELESTIQEQIKSLWPEVNTENLESLTDIAGYRTDFYNLFGFEFDNIDYSAEVDAEVDIPSIESETA